jgi:hypothetical protein
LRQRLADYFSAEGRDEQVVVSIPKGHYVPVFELRASAQHLPSSPRVYVSPRWLIVILLLSTSLLGALVWSQRSARSPAGLWGPFFSSPGQDLTVISADAGFALWQDITNHNLNLGDYLSRRWYLQSEVSDENMREVAVRRFTSPADLSFSVHIAEIARAYGRHVRVKFARNVDIQEVRSGNLVLLGSRRSNPWVELFEPRMNFVLEFDPNLHGPAFRNRSPKPGEPKIVSLDSRLSVQGPEAKLIQSYAVAALLQSPTGRGNVVIVEGLSMEGTEAAGELLTDPERFGMLLRRIGWKGAEPIRPFEVLLKLTAIAGGYAGPELIAFRYPDR